jgi:glucosamine-6-phosphate deaminase
MSAQFSYGIGQGFPFRNADAARAVRRVSRAEFERPPSPNLTIEVIDDEGDFFQSLADEFVARIARAREEGRRLVLGIPSGPAAHYSLAAAELNRRRIGLDHVTFFALAEYADERDRTAPRSWKGSFQQILFDGFFDRLDPDLRPRPEDVHFPAAERPEEYSVLVQDAGGLDVCYGGVGWAGHFAFWEPQLGEGYEGDLERYRELGSRTVDLHPTSVLQVALGRGGDWADVPPRAVTIGPRELLHSRERRFWLTHALMPGAPVWQRFIARLVAHGPVDPTVPASLLQLAPSHLVVHGPVADALED